MSKRHPLLDIDGAITDEAVKKVTKKKKSPLAGVAEFFKKMSPEEKVAWQKEMMETMRKSREERERKEREPPHSPEGECVFCRGLVKGEWVHGLRPGTDSRFVPIGPGSRAYYGWQFKGYHCHGCGLVYRFPPPKGIVTRQGEAHESGEPAKADQGRG